MGKRKQPSDELKDIPWCLLLRLLRGLSIADVAAASGVSRVQISRYERDARHPRDANANAIAAALQFPVELVFPRPGEQGVVDVINTYLALAWPSDEESPRLSRADDAAWVDQQIAADEAEGQRRESAGFVVVDDSGRVIGGEVRLQIVPRRTATRARGAGKPKGRKQTRPSSAESDDSDPEPPGPRARREFKRGRS